MKSSEFADAMRKSANLMVATDAALFRALAEVFAASPAATVAATVKRLTGIHPAPSTPSIAQSLNVFAALLEFVRSYGKQGLSKDLDTVMMLLKRFPQAGISQFVDEAVAALSKPAAKPKRELKEHVVLYYLGRLEETLGDDTGFTIFFNDLEHDPEAGKLEVIELAKRFTEAASKSRAAALKKIWARHHALVTLNAKSQSRDGRSAA